MTPTDRVLTVNDYYDGPRLGIAELDGVPHIYEAEFDHSSDHYGDTYFLAPVDSDLLSLVLEDWQIWCRWQQAHSRKEVDLDTHPALPNERVRHEELKTALGDRLKVNPNACLYRRAKFDKVEAVGDWDGLVVTWSSANDA